LLAFEHDDSFCDDDDVNDAIRLQRAEIIVAMMNNTTMHSLKSYILSYEYTEETILRYFFSIAVLSFLTHELLHLVSATVFPKYLFGEKKWRKLPKHRQAQVVHAPNQILNGLLAGLGVRASLERFPSALKKNGTFDVGRRLEERGGGAFEGFLNLLTRGGVLKGGKGKAVTFRRSTVLATAASCGYLMYDFLLLTLFDRKNMLRAHGRRQYVIYIAHHVLPLLMWPVATRYGTFEYFVAWGVRSELSQAAMGLRTICIGMGILDTIYGVIVQLNFVGVYFWVRMWPLLDHVRSMAKADWFAENVPKWQLPFAFFTVPVPAMLNVYWWFMIMGAFWKVVSGGNKKKKEA